MASSTVFRSFAAGELAPAWHSRADLTVYANGLRTCRNFLIGRHGGALNRPGTIDIGACKTDSEDVRLVRYVHETPGESVLIEMGVNYLRFYLNDALVAILPGDFPAYDNGATYTPGRVVVSAGLYYIATATTTGNLPTDPDFWTELTALDDDGNVIYEVPTPFDFPRETKWAQSGRVITFTQQGMRPRTLTYIASDEWRLEEVTTVSGIAIPQNPVVTQAADEVTITYEVRGVAGTDAGPLSVAFTDTFAPPNVDSPITITWDAPSGGTPPDYYEVFKNGAFLGAPPGLTMDDIGQATGDPWSPGTGGGIVDPPENVDATQPAVVPPTSTYRYVVTAVVGGEESFASDIASDDLEVPTDRPHAIAWDAVTDASAYNIYADLNGNGVYGFIGTSATNGFFYYGTPAPDYAHTPPTDSAFFASSDDFPACAGYYEQRRLFGNTVRNPDQVKGSRTGLPNNFTVSAPVVDSDAISFRLIGLQQHAVRQILGVNDLVLLTDGGEWRSRSAPGVPITPFNLPFKQDTYVGCHATARAVVIGAGIVYVQARGRKVVEAKFTQELQSLANKDLTIFATHLFETNTVDALDYQYEAHSIVWGIRADGALVGLTYLPESDVLAWHRHDTGAEGAFEDVCVIPAASEDVAYFIVSRTIDGDTVRRIERLANRTEARVFLDAAVVYDGVAVSSLTGLEHLEGETVGIYAGGRERGTAVVSAGAVALGGSYTAVVVGLPIEADLETLDLDAAGSDVRDRKKQLKGTSLLLDASVRNFKLGPSSTKLVRVPAPQDTQGATGAFSGLYDAGPLTTAFEQPGRLFLRHDKPTALSVIGLVPRYEVGG